MARIIKLPEQISNLIAAGEVVERPGSVVKELVENAVDAGASRIAVEIQNGGISYLRVSDDGSGIDPEDVRAAFLRHATSKIRSEGDLAAISTMGFRGEALAAVASVAKVDMFTRTRYSPVGVQITVEGGDEKAFFETGCPVGTTVVVRELFYNVPARAKFLKKDSTEASYVENAIMQAAVARPDISFKLIKNGRESVVTAGDGKMNNAVYSVCGKEIAAGLLAVAGYFGNITVDGFVSHPMVSRANRNMQYFFVNSRPVHSRVLAAALEQAYKGRLMSGRYPACFLNIHLHPSAVDVNVHPAKLEVKFSRERDVFSNVYHATLTTLEAFDSHAEGSRSAAPAPVQDNLTGAQQEIVVEKSGPGLTFSESFKGISYKAASGNQISYKTRHDEATPQPRPVEADEPEPEASAYRITRSPAETAPEASPAALAPTFKPEAETEAKAGEIQDEIAVRLIGEAFRTYIIAEGDNGVWIIDKHAAHERMIYNRLLTEAGDIPAQLLLSPAIIGLSRQEKAVCVDNSEAFMKAGFEIEDFGGSNVIVRQVPAYIEEEDIGFVLSDIAGRLSEARPAESAVLDALLKSIACKSAIKAGQYSSHAELEAFANTVLNMPDVRNCPHGRPVATHMSRYEMEKLFGRVK